MKKFWEASSRQVAFGLACWLIASVVFAYLAHSTGWWPIKILLFVCLIFLPGIALLRSLGIEFKKITSFVLYSFGLSVLILMISGLLVNQLLPLFHVAQPLEFWWILGGWFFVTALVIAIGVWTNPLPIQIKKWSPKSISKPSLVIVILSLLLPCLAVGGAFRLNNGGDGVIALITLFFAAGLIGGVFLLRRRLSDGVLAWFIFSLGLTILLMTSLRGWDILGHDIEREFRVYTLTHMHMLWDIALDRDPYNACLSITILPEIFTRLLDVSGLVVFKVILQMIFAACPAILFVLLRRYVSKFGALVGCVLFISYPTFINDSAMLTRQGVAYLFFALALLVMANKLQNWRRKLLFLLCSLGAILSHYSTAYMFVALFAAAVICKLLIMWLYKLRKKPSPNVLRKTVLSPLFAVLLFGMTFIWYSQITGTSSGLVATIGKSLANIPKTFSNDNKSSDTSTALLFASSKTQADLYQAYLTKTRPSGPGATMNQSAYIASLTDDSLPLTPLGQKARSIGLNPSIIGELRQNFAKVLQVLALVGVVYVTYAMFRKKPDVLGSDFVFLSVAGIVLLALLVVLPVLSINYGVLRAFQQALIFLVLPIALLFVSIGRRVNHWILSTIATTSAIALFLLFTGVFAQLLGGTSPSLSMNNMGLYYGLYDSSDVDAHAFAWLKTHIPKIKDVRASNFNRAFMHDPKYPFSRSGMLPSQIGTDTYIYADPAQVLNKKIYAYYDSSPLIMMFPTEYYDMTKNRIYSTTSTRVYR